MSEIFMAVWISKKKATLLVKILSEYLYEDELPTPRAEYVDNVLAYSVDRGHLRECLLAARRLGLTKLVNC